VINKVMVANRGEIALRVLRTCRELGMRTVAVFSEADRYAPHVRYADEAFCIGGPPVQDSYLCGERIISTARDAGVDAVHPGYGFLSESSEFARECKQAGLAFIGPRPETVELFGDKVAARQIALGLGIPVIEGSNATLDNRALMIWAHKLGYPLLLKAAAGGGGMGIRSVNSRRALRKAIPELRSKAKRMFGNDRIYLERLVVGARHIEVQILGDQYGQVLHLGERECSIQRRHQKLVEESPSPSVNEDLRRRLCDAAVRIGTATGYVGAGTVEFLVDSGDNYFFLEVNPRLQVEHTVTEVVTGVDIVREQLRIAGGRRVRDEQHSIPPWGWALQCRILAEDPYKSCQPTSGQVTHLVEPGGPGIRVDSGIVGGNTVSRHYDSMLAKLISWGNTRAEAIVRMRRALDEYEIAGLVTNLDLHRAVFDNYRFFTAQLHTRFLQEDVMLPTLDGDLRKAAALAAVLLEHRRRSDMPRTRESGRDSWKTQGDWELMREWSAAPVEGWPPAR